MKAEHLEVDMSPEAIAERIETVGQLYRVCRSLMDAKPIARPVAATVKLSDAPDTQEKSR